MKYHIAFFACTLYSISWCFSCSVLYYVDSTSGGIYVVNNEDYWYDVKPYIRIESASQEEYARLWYGWDNFAQGGVNEHGLFFDGAVTPKQNDLEKFNRPQSNLGDDILANCRNVTEAINFIRTYNIGLDDSHIMFGDGTGTAVVVEWIEGKEQLQWISGNRLVMTNFLLADTTQGNYPCARYSSIHKKLDELEKTGNINLLRVGNTIVSAVQTPTKNDKGRIGGTLYSTFLDLTSGIFFLSFKLSNDNVIRLDLNKEFENKRSRKIKLKD